MAVVKRDSGVSVSIEGAAELGTTAAPTTRRGAGAIKRGKAGVSGRPTDSEIVMAALESLDSQLVDSIPVTFPPAARPSKRGVIGPASELTLDVPLADDEQAVVLLEDEGEFRWVVDGRTVSAGPAAPKRGRRSATTPGRVKRFKVRLEAASPAPAISAKRGAKRGWVADKLVGTVTAYVFRFAIKAVGKSAVKFLERNVSRGLIAITSPDPARWSLLGDEDELPVGLPSDRAARVLLLVHGTFSSTIGSFGALGAIPAGREFLDRALQSYDAVVGFDHPTLSVDPLENAKALLKRLRAVRWPKPPQLDMIAFSRGGLVARSLVEYLLPSARWPVAIGRVVFVGCTNGGTQLAEPDNWHRFADHYTNLALGVTRALSLVPGAQGVTLIAGHAIRGVGALVKALATGVVADKLVPGIAAMEPDGEFVLGINREQPGQPTPAMTRYAAITSNFEPGAALRDGSTPELPPKLLMRVADWGADELYGEPNDLVVHVSSMTEIDPSVGEHVKDTLDYGTNGFVYHTNYFTREATAKKLVEWLDLGSATAPGAKRGGRARTTVKATKRTGTKRGVKAAVKEQPVKRAPKKAAKKPAKKAARKPAKKAARKPAKKAAKKAAVRKTSRKAAPKKPMKRKAVVRTGVRKAAPKMPVRKRAKSKRPPMKKMARGGGGGFVSGRTAVGDDLRAGGSGSSGPFPVNVQVGSQKRGPILLKRGSKQAKAAPREMSAGKEEPSTVDCHFRAEMDGEVVVDKTVSVDVTIARHELELTVGRVGETAGAKVEEHRKLIVQIAERRNFRVEGERRVEIGVPKPGEEANVSFDVVGLVADSDGELWVQVRQGPVPLVTLKLKPRIVLHATPGPVKRLPPEVGRASFSAAALPIDQLIIEECLIGNGVQYRYYLDLPSLELRKHFESKTFDDRDGYIKTIVGRIGQAWTGTGSKKVAAFETDLKGIGARMFRELLPREMQDLLWENRDRITGVQVFSMEPFIPWEMLLVTDPREGTFKAEDRFLAEYGLVRWLYDSYPPAHLTIGAGRARYVIPEYSGKQKLPKAADEVALLRKLFNAQRVQANAFDVQQLVRTPGSFDLLHFGGHGEAAGTDLDDARLLLEQSAESTEEALLATTVEETAQLGDGGRRPIVVLNACETARMNRTFAGMGGFAKAFVSRGAGVFVGTQWSVGDSSALTFIEAFYELFTGRKGKSKPLSEAVLGARQAARNAGDATWLAYVVYGHPRAVVEKT